MTDQADIDRATLSTPAREIIDAGESSPQPDTLAFPDTEKGRQAAAIVNELTAKLWQPRRPVHVIKSHATERSNRRRSRQCRGSRARNYVRAVTRAANGLAPDSNTSAVLADAKHSGALAAAQRQQEKMR